MLLSWTRMNTVTLTHERFKTITEQELANLKCYWCRNIHTQRPLDEIRHFIFNQTVKPTTAQVLYPTTILPGRSISARQLTNKGIALSFLHNRINSLLPSYPIGEAFVKCKPLLTSMVDFNFLEQLTYDF